MAKVIFRSVSYDHSNEGYFSFKSIDQNDTQVEDIDVVVGKTNVTAKDNARIYGSCNGLLLIRIGIDLFLWNPCVCSTVGKISYSSLVDYDYVVPGLCFNSNTNEYKAVLALTDNAWHVSVVVGSFKTKSWRNIDFRYENEFISGPTLNNLFHLLLYDDNSPPVNILYFDPKKEEVVDLPMPEAEEGKGSDTDALGVLDGCLCMSRKETRIGATEVLVMKEYGVKESWTVLFKFTHGVGRNPIHGAFPLFFTGEVESEVLMHVQREDGEEVIATYYINTDSWKEIAIVNAENPYDMPIMYEEETSVVPTVNKTASTGTAKIAWEVEEWEVPGRSPLQLIHHRQV